MYMMSRPYDIFRKDPSRQAVWVEAVDNLEQARQRIIELGARRPGQYMIYCQETQRLVSTMTMLASPAARDEHRNRDGRWGEFAPPPGSHCEKTVF